MATVYLRPHSPRFVRGGHLHTCSTGQYALNTNMKNVGLARSAVRGIYQGIEGHRVGCGWVGRLTGRMRHVGGKASWGWAAEGARRDNI
eukprot:scaffold25569_cov61-Phaeocystis_antarctica.AAC.3